MQKAIYHWLFFAFLLLKPIGTDGKIDSKKGQTPPFSNPVFAETHRSFPTVNPLDHVKMPRILRKFLKKRLYTEGTSKNSTSKSGGIWGRIITILLIAIGVVLLVYWLQGTIGLTLATVVIASYWRNRRAISDWETRRKLASQTDYPAAQPNQGNTNSLNNSANKFTRRALWRFLIGISLVFSTLIIALLAILSTPSVAFGIFLLGLFLLGCGFSLVSIVNAFQAISAKEPQNYWGWLVITLGVPLLLSFFSLVLSLALI